MNLYLLLILLITSIAVFTFVTVNTITGGIITEENPCKIVDCHVRIFGFWNMEADWIDTTPEGLAVCHCPHEPLDRLYYISTYRKY